jgi:hypothetical protein
VDICPTQAIRFGEETELADLIEKAEKASELPAATRVHYLNLPKRFVAGTVYDPGEEEVIIGAACTLRELKSGETFTVETDSFGDFWFENLDTGDFSLKIAFGGIEKTVEKINTREDVNLGDIPLKEAEK